MKRNHYKKASSRIAKRNKARKYAGLTLKIGLPIAVIIGAVFILREDFLQVRNFEVVGAENVMPKDIKNLASNLISGNSFFVIPKSNIFLLSDNKLAAAVEAEFGRVAQADVSKQFLSGSVTITVKERQADYLWCSADAECFFMTKDGLVFEKASFSASDFLASPSTWAEPINKLIFEGNLQGNPLMKNFATPGQMQNYLKLVSAFKTAGFEIISINIESADEATAKSNIGGIIFDPQEADLSTVAQNAILLINNIQAKNPSASFNYIDVRFGNKVYYRLGNH